MTRVHPACVIAIGLLSACSAQKRYSPYDIEVSVRFSKEAVEAFLAADALFDVQTKWVVPTKEQRPAPNSDLIDPGAAPAMTNEWVIYELVFGDGFVAADAEAAETVKSFDFANDVVESNLADSGFAMAGVVDTRVEVSGGPIDTGEVVCSSYSRVEIDSFAKTAVLTCKLKGQ